MGKNNLNFNINYVAVLFNSTIEDCRLFNKYVKNDYPWLTGIKPKLYERMLITPICYGIRNLDKILKEQKARKDKGDLKTIIFDSGGFQALTKGYSLDKLINENQYLYKRYAYLNPWLIMPDLPSPPEDILSVMEQKMYKSIEATFKLYNLLPNNLKTKSMPVFHARNVSHIDIQAKVYREIINGSNKACYAIGGINKKLNERHIRNIIHLKKLFPNIYLHLLGVASPMMVWIMNKIGVNSFDAITPHRIATLGMINYHYGRLYYSTLIKQSVSNNTIHQINDKIGHRCPFCDNLKKLKQNVNYRRFHNYIVYNELNYFYSQLLECEYQTLAPKCYNEYKNALKTEIVTNQLKINFEDDIN